MQNHGNSNTILISAHSEFKVGKSSSNNDVYTNFQYIFVKLAFALTQTILITWNEIYLNLIFLHHIGNNLDVNMIGWHVIHWFININFVIFDLCHPLHLKLAFALTQTILITWNEIYLNFIFLHHIGNNLDANMIGWHVIHWFININFVIFDLCHPLHLKLAFALTQTILITWNEISLNFIFLHHIGNNLDANMIGWHVIHWFININFVIFF